MKTLPSVLHVITGLNTGGAERALHRLLASAAARESTSAVVVLGHKGTIGPAIEALGIPVFALDLPRARGLARVLPTLRAALAEAEPAVIQGWMYHGNVAAWLAQRLATRRPALAWNIRQTLYALEAEKPLTRQVVRANRALSGAPDAIVYNSERSRRQHEAFGFTASEGVLIPNGFDLQRLCSDGEARAGVRRELGIPLEARLVGHVARLHPMKDHASFLRAAAAVARRDESVRFLLAGREVAPSHPSLAGLIPPELEHRFVFAGERADPERLIQAMDALATSSAWGEGLPNVVGEAMACGVPCVVTDVGDSAELVGDTGVVVPPADWQALSRGLHSMLAKSSEQRRALGEAARARLRAGYDLESVVDRYADLYADLARGQRRA